MKNRTCESETSACEMLYWLAIIQQDWSNSFHKLLLWAILCVCESYFSEFRNQISNIQCDQCSPVQESD